MRYLLAATVVVAASMMAAPTASAQLISRQNPYRTLNIHGYNYGSTRWEKQRRSGGRSYGSVPSYRSGYRGSSSRFYSPSSGFQRQSFRSPVYNNYSSRLYRRR